MFAKDILTDEERTVDVQLGYPQGYVKLCRHAYIQMQGLITPFTEGPPQRFLPYVPLDEELAKLKEFDTLFPIINEEERDLSNARRHSNFLWQQLDHLGNAGFDPSKFRVDAYGNVVYWNADPGSPLAWEVDHWFPHSRGGKTVLSNLRIVQWQANQRKSTKLEFLVPWWDLQIGVSVNQFLSVFSSKNTEFRQRAFSLFFLGGESEQLDDNLVVECHSWPQPFRERKHQVGLAAAALVKVQKHMDDPLKVLSNSRATKQNLQLVGGAATPARRRWTSDEEEALKRALQKFGPGNWKEIKEFEPVLVNRSTVQIKDKYRLMRGEWQLDKENREEPLERFTASIQREEQLKQTRAEEKKQKEEDLVQLEEKLSKIKAHNEKEKLILEELEQSLAKQRKRVEKQRRWSETQSQYRLCLEKMIRDTMHQSVLYKEQARLNQAACNALLARLESQKSACDAAERDFLKRVKQREGFEALARPKITKRTRNERHTDVGSCIKLCANVNIEKNTDTQTSSEPDYDEKEDEVNGCGSPLPVSSREKDILFSKEALNIEKSSLHNKDKYSKGSEEQQDDGDGGDFLRAEMMSKTALPTNFNSSESSGTKRKALEGNHLDDVVLLRQEYEEQEEQESVGGTEISKCDFDHEDLLNKEVHKAKPFEPQAHSNVAVARTRDQEQVDELLKEVHKAKPLEPQAHSNVATARTKDEEQVDELLKEVLEMKGKAHAAMADAIEDEEDEEHRVTRVGKFNLDKWLQMLLLNPGKYENPASEVDGQDNPHVKNHVPESQETTGDSQKGRKGHGDTEEPVKGGVIGGFFKKLSFKQGETPGIALQEPNLVMPNNAETLKDFKAEDSTQNKMATERATSPSFRRASSVNAMGNATISWRRKPRVPCDEKDLKAEERKVIEGFSRLKLDSNGKQASGVAADDFTENSEVAFQIACEAEFVEKMRAARERDQRRRRHTNAGIPHQLKDLMGDSSSQEQEVGCDESQSTSLSSGTHIKAEIDPSITNTTAQVDPLISLPALSPRKAKVNDLRRHSLGHQASMATAFTRTGMPRNHQHQGLTRMNVEQHMVSMTPPLLNRTGGPRNQHHQNQVLMNPSLLADKTLYLPQHNPQNFKSQQPPTQQVKPERSLSTPPGAQFRQALASQAVPGPSSPLGSSKLQQQRQSSLPVAQNVARQLSRQQTTGHAVIGSGGAVMGAGSGGAARKASMLMKSASTRGAGSGGRADTSSSGSAGSPARSSSSSGGRGRRGGEGEAEVVSLRRKASFFQDWDANEGLRASLSHVWKKAVKKFDLARQQTHHQ